MRFSKFSRSEIGFKSQTLLLEAGWRDVDRWGRLPRNTSLCYECNSPGTFRGDVIKTKGTI